MKNLLIVLIVSFVLSFTATLSFTPHILMSVINLNGLIQGSHGNLSIRPRAEAGKDKIVRMSPDLLYSVCTFNLNDGPYRISAPPIESYMSVAFFAQNSDNFFTINDTSAPNGINILLADSDSDVQTEPGETLVTTGSSHGLVLFRYYLGDKPVTEFDKVRQKANCSKV